MANKIELLAPGGDVDSIKAAILAGADAIYCGLDKFNARNRATNISFDDLQGILRLAQKNSCEIFITLNIIILETEMPAVITLLNKLVNTDIDGIIVQDLGLLHLVQTYFPSLKVHASTQLTTHNAGQIKFLDELGASRVNLCRELNINEISDLTSEAHRHDMMTEVFVHGSNCISFSGLCYISSVRSGNSGNRGRCSQSCRNRFTTTAVGKDYPLNLKDNSAFPHIESLVKAGVDSLKIEGRIKKFDYVYTVVNSWRKHIDSHLLHDKIIENDRVLKTVFNRDLTDGFLTGQINKDLFIDNPRDNSARNLAKSLGDLSPKGIDEARAKINRSRAEIMTEIESGINQLSIEKSPVVIKIAGTTGEQLTIEVKTTEFSINFRSKSNLQSVKSKGLNYDSIYLKLKAINETAYCIKLIDLENLEPELSIPFKELSDIRKQIIQKLNGSRKFIEPVELPKLKIETKEKRPTLAIIISSIKDLHLYTKTTAKIYFKLPDSLGNGLDNFVKFFNQNPEIIPWFPSVLIGDDYAIAVELLHRINTTTIVTDNTGIAYDAWQRKVEWIAGPNLNITNSYSLNGLKTKFNCSGAFLSNELNNNQLRNIKAPADFKLFYRIFHPVELMISRQCLFFQVSGCHKTEMDQNCMQDCQKKDTINQAKKEALLLRKSRGNYNRIYNAANFLNTDIVRDFDSLFVDLSAVDTTANMKLNNQEITKTFKSLLTGKRDAEKELHKILQPTTCTQYKKGI